MSGIVGIYEIGNKRVTAGLVGAMLSRMKHSERDCTSSFENGPVALGHAAFRIVPAASIDVRPLSDETGSLYVVMDGRLDNREELRAALISGGILLRSGADSELVLRSYELWGERCAQHMIGTFAFAVWDARTREVICCRDALGAKSLYFFQGKDFFIFASEPGAFFADPRISPKPNLNAFLTFVLNDATSDETEFAGIHRVRPGHVLVASEKGVRSDAYWDVDISRVLRLKDSREYDEAFLEVFTAALKSQARGVGRVGISLSGGLDSSSVTCLAEDLRSRGELDCDLRAYSLIFNREPYDEREFVAAVQRRWGTDVHWCSAPAPTPLWGDPQPLRAQAHPSGNQLTYMAEATFAAASRDGTRVLLDGVGGDNFLDVPGRVATDLLCAAHPVRALRFLRRWREFSGISAHGALLYGIVGPLRARFIPGWLRRAYRRARPRVPFSWIREPYRTMAVELLRQEPCYLRGRDVPLHRRSAYAAVHNGYLERTLEALGELGVKWNVEGRQPLCDRRLAEFALSVPDAELARGWRPKGMFRDALGDRLPELVRERRSKAEFSALAQSQLAANLRLMEDLLRDPILEELGFVDGEIARSRFEYFRKLLSQLTFENSVNTMLPTDELWFLVSLEAWTRANFWSTSGEEHYSGGKDAGKGSASCGKQTGAPNS